VSTKFPWITLVTNNNVLKRSELLLPLKSPARRVEYNVYGPNHDAEVNEDFTIVPEAVTVVLGHLGFAAQFHTKFLQASGTLREMGLIYSIMNQPSTAQQKEILTAIKENQNLHRLELGRFNLDMIWDELLEIMSSHTSLRAVVFWESEPGMHASRQPHLDEQQTSTLKVFMQKHEHLDISFEVYGPWKGRPSKVDTIVAPIRIRNRARRLTRESSHDRSVLVAAALTKCVSGNFKKTGIMLSENADLLCSLMDQPFNFLFEAPPERHLQQEEDPQERLPKRRKSSRSSGP
jgi:hypothetical protein